MLLDERSKEVFRKHMHTMADFCEVPIFTYGLVSNPVHLLVRVPELQPISDDEWVRRYCFALWQIPW